MPTRETATFLGYPFDSELFMQIWTETPDPVLTAMLNSGAMVTDAAIAARIKNDGNLYTIPFYNTLTGDPANYDGQTDIPTSETDATSQSGIVYGRTRGWFARNFVAELSGADPMGHIARSTKRYWDKYRQKVIIGIINAIFNTSDTSNFAKEFKKSHILDTGAPVEVTDANLLMTRSMGDHKSEYSLAIMHSTVAMRLENAEVLKFWVNTAADGVQRRLNLASWHGMTVIIDDSVPYDGATGKYTTYLLGNGVLRQANGRLDRPFDVAYDPEKNGGQETLYTRIRETIHPNGFSFVVPSTGWTESPTDAQLFSGDNWRMIFDPKAVPIAKLITTETPVVED